MFNSATRVILLIGAGAFAICLCFIVYHNVNDKEIVIPLVTGILSFYGGFSSWYFQGRKAEENKDLPPTK